MLINLLKSPIPQWNSGADVQPNTLVDAENSEDALIERLNTS